MAEIVRNSILVTSMKNRINAEIQFAYLKLLHRIKVATFAPKRHVLDNDISDAIKFLMQPRTRPSTLSPTQRDQSGHQGIQATFPQHPCRGRNRLPWIQSGTSSPTGRTNPQPPSTSLHNTKCICACLSLQSFWLQLHANQPHVMRCRNPRKPGVCASWDNHSVYG